MPTTLRRGRRSLRASKRSLSCSFWSSYRTCSLSCRQRSPSPSLMPFYKDIYFIIICELLELNYKRLLFTSQSKSNIEVVSFVVNFKAIFGTISSHILFKHKLLECRVAFVRKSPREFMALVKRNNLGFRLLMEERVQSQ